MGDISRTGRTRIHAEYQRAMSERIEIEFEEYYALEKPGSRSGSTRRRRAFSPIRMT